MDKKKAAATLEKYFVVAHFGGKSYSDGGIVLVRDSGSKKEILAIGPWSGGGYIVEDWPTECHESLRGNRQLDLNDSVWDAVVRYKKAKDEDSKREEQAAKVAFEKLIGYALVLDMHLAGAA